MDRHRKGSRWRRSVELWLASQGFSTRFRPIGVPGDDITAERGGLRLSVEAKNVQRFDLAGWIAQAEGNCPEGAVPVVVAHRPRRSEVADCYVILSGSAFAALIGAPDPLSAGSPHGSTETGRCVPECLPDATMGVAPSRAND